MTHKSSGAFCHMEEGGDVHCAGMSSDNEDGHEASREDQRAASDKREMSETPDEDTSETPRHPLAAPTYGRHLLQFSCSDHVVFALATIMKPVMLRKCG